MQLKILDFGFETQNDENDCTNVHVKDKNIWRQIIYLIWPKKFGYNEFFKSKKKTIEFKWTRTGFVETGGDKNLECINHVTPSRKFLSLIVPCK